jgi:hypothetical protein
MIPEGILLRRSKIEVSSGLLLDDNDSSLQTMGFSFDLIIFRNTKNTTYF